MDILRKCMADKCLKWTRKVKKLKKHREDVRSAVDSMWSCLGKGDYDGVKRLLSYLKEVKKQHILKLKSKKETMPVEHKQICAHLDTGNVSLDGFRVDIGNGFAAVVSQENNEPNVSVVSRSLVEIPMTRAEWDALLSTGPVISSIFELIS